MDKLAHIPAVTQLRDNVVRILGQNPGKFTLQGTNTYLLGRQNPFTLVDTGEGRVDYLSILESALRERISKPDRPVVSDIIITHRHLDHAGGLPSVLELLSELWTERGNSSPFRPPRIHKLPLPASETDTGLESLINNLVAGSYEPTSSGSALHDLADNQTLSASGLDLQILHTPGHTTDSMCIYLPSEKVLFTADTVLGQGTAVFEDLSALISSLGRMLQWCKDNDCNTIYPGHGPVLENGQEAIATYISHRLDRENQILDVLKSKREGWSIWDIVSVIYAAYPQNLWLPAAHGVRLHLLKLESDGKVRNLGGEGKDEKWELMA